MLFIDLLIKGKFQVAQGSTQKTQNSVGIKQHSCKVLSCATARLVTGQHPAPFARILQIQTWSRTDAVQPRGSEHIPLHTHSAGPTSNIVLGKDEPIPSTNYVKSQWGMWSWREAEPKGAEETWGHLSCRCILSWSLQRDLPLWVYKFLTCFTHTHGIEIWLKH